MKKTICVRIPASAANLGPGFDVIGVALKLYNEIEVTLDPADRAAKNGRFRFDVEGEGKETLPRDKKNIVWQAMQKVFAVAGQKGRRPPIARIRLVNAIPLSSGLGSSAAARLGGILAANEVLGRALSREEILSLGLALEGHPDNIVPALSGGFCVSALDGNRVRYVKLPAPALSAVVCTPDFELPTKQARRVLPRRFPLSTVIFNTSRLALLMAALQCRQYPLMDLGMEDRLHQPSRERLIPGMDALFSAAKKAGAYGVALSGAGPSIVAFCPRQKARNVAQHMIAQWQRLKIASRSFVLDFDTRGARVVTR